MRSIDLLADSRGIYGHLCDEESRFVYDKRVLFSMTQEWNHIRELVSHSAQMFAGGGYIDFRPAESKAKVSFRCQLVCACAGTAVAGAISCGRR